MKNSFYAIALSLLILSCNYDKSSNGNIDQAYAKEDYAAVHGQHKVEIRERKKAATQFQKENAKAEVVKDTAAVAVPEAKDSIKSEESHH